MININGENWRILLVSPEHPQLWIDPERKYALGVCDDIQKKIYINDTLSNQLLKKVLAHELTHAAMFSYNVPLGHEEEELVADLIATYGQEIIEHTNTIFLRIKEKREDILK